MIPTQDLHLGLTLGANEIGTLISSVFLGITTVQLYIYYKNDFQDSRWIRFLVSFVWISETIHTVFVWIYLYDVTVSNYGNSAVLGVTPWTLCMSAVFDGIIGGTVQAYFAYRIYIFSNHLLLPVVSWTLSATQLAANMGIAVIGVRVSLQEFVDRFSWIITTSLASNLSADVLNTAGLCCFLLKERSHNRIKRTIRTVDQLILWTLETGLVTSIAAVLMLALFLGKSGTALWIAITLFYAKLYSNCFFASLNGRVSLRENSSNTCAGLSLGALEFNIIKPQDSQAPPPIVLDITNNAKRLKNDNSPTIKVFKDPFEIA